MDSNDGGSGAHDGHIPFRGEEHPQKRGHRSPPHPHEKWHMLIWALFIVLISIILVYFAITAKEILTATMSIIGILFMIMLLWATQDVARIKTVKSFRFRSNIVKSISAKSAIQKFKYSVILPIIIITGAIGIYFGVNSSLTLITTIIIGTISLFAFLIIQNSRD